MDLVYEAVSAKCDMLSSETYRRQCLAQLVKEFPMFRGPQGLLLCAQELETGPCSELYESTLHSSHLFL